MKGKTSKTTNPEALKVELEAVQARIYHSGAEGACQPVNRRTSFQERGCRACAVAVHQQLQVSALVNS